MLTRFFCILALLASCASLAVADSTTQPSEKPVVAVFDLGGPMHETPVDDSLALFSPSGHSLQDVVSRMEKAAKDPHVKAIVVLADDSEFGYAQAAELRKAMRDLRSAGKEVFAHSDDVSMLQYVLLSGATRLSVAPTGEIWAMGMYGDQIYLHGLLVKLGIQPDFLHCGAYKSASEIFMRDGPSPEADQMTNWLFDSIFDTSINLIASGRNVSPEQAKQWIDGGPYTAEKARDAGMLDAVEDLAGMESVLKQRYGDNVLFDKKYGEKKPPELNFSNPFAMMGVLAQMMNPPKSGEGKPAIGVIYVDGPIVLGKSDDSLLGSDVAASADIVKALDQAADDDSIKAVVLRVDSPGGSATASEIILRATERVKAKKPFVVSMGDVAGSGGYYVTCAADNVFADDATLTASIGVVGGKLATTDMWNKIGVTFKGYQRGAGAGILSTDATFTPEQRQRMQNWMDEIYGVFKDHVTAIRGSKLKKPIDDLAAGRVFTGRQALDLGLVDRIGTLQDAIAFAADQAKMKEYEVRTVPEPKNFLQKLMEKSAGDDDQTSHVTASGGGDWIAKLAEPYLAGMDPAHLRIVRMALGQLQLIQREQVMLMMPAIYCAPPSSGTN